MPSVAGAEMLQNRENNFGEAKCYLGNSIS
jgi:hypothetical protein